MLRAGLQRAAESSEEKMKKSTVYEVFAYWLRERERGGATKHSSLKDAKREAESLANRGFGQEGRDEIQIWKVTKERVQ